LPDIDCGTFTLHEELITEEFTETTFYDEAGEVDRVLTRITFLRDHVAVNAVTEGGRTLASGIGFNLVRPGQGAGMQLIGRRIETEDGHITLAGPDDVQADLHAAICSALA
jgi:hypothetical protein